MEYQHTGSLNVDRWFGTRLCGVVLSLAAWNRLWLSDRPVPVEFRLEGEKPVMPGMRLEESSSNGVTA